MPPSAHQAASALDTPPHSSFTSRTPIAGTVAISGGLGGLGRAMAAELIRCGARALLLGTQPRSVVADRIALLGNPDRVAYAQADATDSKALADAFAQVTQLSAAIANAGVTHPEPFLELKHSTWRETMRVNLDGTFLFAQAAARHMVASGHGGALILVGSWIQDMPEANQAAYSASKAAVHMLARSMALELGPHNIRVNTLAPGIVEAGMAQRHMDADPDYARQARRAAPLCRLQTPQEVAKAAAFLCSDDSSYITGSVLLADGGVSLCPGSL